MVKMINYSQLALYTIYSLVFLILYLISLYAVAVYLLTRIGYV